MQTDRSRRRSVGFLEQEGEEWACFLVTYPEPSGRWRGYFSFRPRNGKADDDEIRTADIFLEAAECDIDGKARGLGRPLLSGLLASALHTRDRALHEPPELRRWFQEVVRSHARSMGGEWEEEEDHSPEDRTLAELRSIYASYRMDQVAHLISLIPPKDFQIAVDGLLDGQPFDFGARDRLQFAMMVVEKIEGLLPLPPFEAWVHDYLAHPEAYRLYTHTLHRDGRLP